MVHFLNFIYLVPEVRRTTVRKGVEIWGQLGESVGPRNQTKVIRLSARHLQSFYCQERSISDT